MHLLFVLLERPVDEGIHTKGNAPSSQRHEIDLSPFTRLESPKLAALTRSAGPRCGGTAPGSTPRLRASRSRR